MEICLKANMSFVQRLPFSWRVLYGRFHAIELYYKYALEI